MSQMTSCVWLWIYAGALLLLLELIVPGFILCFFGLAAATVGVCRFIFGECFSLTWQLAAFSVFSVLYIVLLRRWLKTIFIGNTAVADTDFDHESVGRVGKVTAAIRPGIGGRVLIGDAEWNAESETAIPEGADVVIVSQHNLTMKVKMV